MGEVEDAIAAGHETTSVDYKERLNWGTRNQKIEILRHLAALANREGGLLVIGMAERPGRSHERVGLATDARMPDPTDIGSLFRQYFDPPVEITTGLVDVDGLTFGWIRVAPFSVMPVIATQDAVGDGTRHILQNGDILIRTEALTTERVKARDLRALLDRAIANRGRAYAADLPPRKPPPDDGRSWGEAAPASMLLELVPTPVSEPRRLRDIERMLGDARVIGRSGAVYMPNGVHLDGRTPVTREPGRVIAQSRELREEDDLATTAEIDENLIVRVREAPWKQQVLANGPSLDLTGVVLFVIAAAKFAENLYGAAEVPGCVLRVGIARPAGYRLWLDPSSSTSLHTNYVASSRSDIWAERSATLAEIGTASGRSEIAFGLCAELIDYFGWEVSRAHFDAQLALIDKRGGLSA